MAAKKVGHRLVREHHSDLGFSRLGSGRAFGTVGGGQGSVFVPGKVEAHGIANQFFVIDDQGESVAPGDFAVVRDRTGR